MFYGFQTCFLPSTVILSYPVRHTYYLILRIRTQAPAGQRCAKVTVLISGWGIRIQYGCQEDGKHPQQVPTPTPNHPSPDWVCTQTPHTSRAPTRRTQLWPGSFRRSLNLHLLLRNHQDAQVYTWPHSLRGETPWPRGRYAGPED